MVQYVYSFRIGIELEPIARSYGFSNVSEFVRDAVFFYMQNVKLNAKDKELIVKLAKIEELYKRYVFLKRMLGTEREIKRFMALSLGDDDLPVEISKKMVKMLEEKKKLEKEVMKSLINMWDVDGDGDE